MTIRKPCHTYCQLVLRIMGPSPVSNEHKYSLIIRDQFTKWYEANPMSNKEASTVARAFVNL